MAIHTFEAAPGQGCLSLTTMTAFTRNLVVLSLNSIWTKIVNLIRICRPRFNGMTTLTITPLLTRMDVFMTPFTIFWGAPVNVVHMTFSAVHILMTSQKSVLGHFCMIKVFNWRPSFGRMTLGAGSFKLPFMKVVVTISTIGLNWFVMTILMTAITGDEFVSPR